MLHEVVGKIVGEDIDKGSWGEVNGIKVFSTPLFGTPHGTIISTGIMHLSDITEEGMETLLQYEMNKLE